MAMFLRQTSSTASLHSIDSRLPFLSFHYSFSFFSLFYSTKREICIAIIKLDLDLAQFQFLLIHYKTGDNPSKLEVCRSLVLYLKITTDQGINF